jgi:hypothetical protein
MKDDLQDLGHFPLVCAVPDGSGRPEVFSFFWVRQARDNSVSGR